jgi:chitodextrinase/alpha-tubulin suppressor-like RCC1 family protein
MGGKVNLLPRWIVSSLALLGVLSFPSAVFSQEFFPQGGALPAGWTTPVGANAGWVVANDASSEGTFSLKSGLPSNTNTNHNQNAGIQVTVTVATPGTVSFDYRVSSETNFDFIRFYINGVEVFSRSGLMVAFETLTFPLPAGTHTLTWRYTKDVSVDTGFDTAWIDNVRLPGTATVAGGYDHSLAIRSNGTVASWGNDTFGQRAGLDGQSNIVQIAGSAQSHTLLLKSDGTVAAQGANGSGQTTVPAGLGNVVAIAAGYDTSYALRSDGTVVAWGSNSMGQVTGLLGVAGAIDLTATYCDAGFPARPCAAARIPGAIAIASSVWHVLALKSDGTVVAWGLNDLGQSTVPGGLGNVVAIAAGYQFSLALRSNGTIVGWGSSTGNNISGPAAQTGAIAISAGIFHSLVLKSDGTVQAFGGNTDGQTDVPVGLDRVVRISAGWYHSLALKSDGTVIAWGWNQFDQSSVPSGLNLDATAPATPTGLAAGAVSGSQINLSWNASLDNTYLETGGVSSGLAAYQVFRNGVQVATVNSPTLTYSDTGLVNGTTYDYRITACDAAGNCSAQSGAASAMTFDTQAPNTPAAPTITNLGANSLTVNWLNPGDNVGVAAYRVFRGGVQIATVNAPTLLYNDSGLVSATSYSYAVAACDAAGNCSASSAATIVTTLDNVPPSVPAGLNITNLAANSLTLNWTASTDNVGVTQYRIRRNGALVQTLTGTPPAVTFNDSGLVSATNYSYTVEACDLAGNCSGQSASVAATTLDNVPPSVPAGLNITNLAANSLTLNWTASTDNVGVTQYRIRRNGALVQTLTGTPPAVTFNDSGLVSATNYSYTVEACDLAGNCSAQSASVAATTLDNVPPSVPAGLNVTNLQPTTLTLNWSASTDNVAVTAYRVFRNGSFIATVNAPTLFFNDSGLVNGTTYLYNVAACDAAGNCSAQSAVLSIMTPDTDAPTVPTGLGATPVSPAQINLAWTASTDNVAVAAYRVFRDGTFRATVNAPTVSFSDTGLSALTTYSYRVAACDAAGNCSAQSAAVSATTFTSFATSLVTGFNQTGNSLNAPIDVVAFFGNQDSPTGVTPSIVSIWKWNPLTDNWAFYSPQLTHAGNIAYATDPTRNYDVLTTINPGEGYWINASTNLTLPPQVGPLFRYDNANFAALAPGGSFNSGWYLIATSDVLTPSDFNILVSPTPPAPGTVPTGNFFSLWTWDAGALRWYFYAPILEAQPGGLANVKAYADNHGFLHFQDTGKTLGMGIGFWVNRP